MKFCTLLLLTVLLKPIASISQNLSNLRWLSGEWIATNSKPQKLRTERWEIERNERMNGFGTVTQGPDTTFLEKMHIEKKEGQLYFVAEVPENKEPVFFRITKLSANGFESENPEHDFPKKIVYHSEANKLSVTISGNGKSIEYKFNRK